MNADLHAVRRIADLPSSQRTRSLVERVLSRTFVQKHSALVDMLVSAQLDVTVLDQVLLHYHKVANGADLHAASVAVGQVLVDKYIPRELQQESSDQQHATEEVSNQ